MKYSAALLALASVASAVDWPVTVGGGDNLFFTPSNVTAAENDTVTFTFMPPFMHSVTQSSFKTPCTALSGGFNSGLQNPGNTWTLTVTNATAPIWFYCEQTTPVKHCGSGMVGAINPPASGNTFSSFSAEAVSIGTAEAAQTAAPALSGVGAVATASGAPGNASSGANSTGSTSGSPSSTGSGSASSPTSPSGGNTTTPSGASAVSIPLTALFGAVVGAWSLM